MPLGDVGEWHLKITRGPSFDGEGRGDGHTARPTCKASSSSRLRRGLRGGNGLCGGLATSVAMGPFVPVSALSVLWLSLFLDRLRPSDRAGPRSRSSGVPLRWWLPRSRALVSLRGLPPWHDQSRSICQIDATSNCRQVALQKQADASANHRSRAGEERSDQPGWNCGASAVTARPTEQRVMS